jgi:hypothetical protein
MGVTAGTSKDWLGVDVSQRTANNVSAVGQVGCTRGIAAHASTNFALLAHHSQDAESKHQRETPRGLPPGKPIEKHCCACICADRC